MECDALVEVYSPKGEERIMIKCGKCMRRKRSTKFKQTFKTMNKHRGLTSALSSSGRNAPFEGVNCGSNPHEATK